MRRVEIRLLLEVERGEPIAGWIVRDAGSTRFEGMLELLAAVDRLRGEEPGERPADG